MLVLWFRAPLERIHYSSIVYYIQYTALSTYHSTVIASSTSKHPALGNFSNF